MRFGKLDCRAALAAVLILFTQSAVAQFCDDFALAKKFDAGSNPLAVAVSDVDDDSRNDIAVATGMNVAILESGGNGHFLDPDDHFVGSTVTSVVLADFNNDNVADVAAGGLAGDNVAVFLNNGFGTFASPVFYASDSPRAIAAADFNGDGKNDLAVANGDPDTVSILINNGTGTFAAGVPYAVGLGPVSVAAGDFDGDNDRDIVVANGETTTVSVLLNNGNGTFAAATHLTVGAGASGVVAGDFNGDNDADIAATSGGTDNVVIFISNGDGTFEAAENYPAGDNPGAIAAGDVDGDTVRDLVVANRAGDSFSVLFGDGDGTFSNTTTYGAGDNPTGVALADLDEDGVTDIAVTSGNSYDIRIFFGAGAGIFASHHGADTFPSDVIARDFDGDGNQDIAIAASDLLVVLGKGNGSFEPMAKYASGFVSAITSDHFNADEILDIAVATYSGVMIYLGAGDGTFGSGAFFDAPDDTRDMTVGDFDADGAVDLALASWANTDVSIMTGNGDGTFDAAVSYDVAGEAYSLVVGNFNANTKPDVAVATPAGVKVLLNNGSGALGSAVTYAAGTSPSGITAADFNDDGKLDLAVSNRVSYNASILTGAGDGTFAPGVAYDVGYSAFDEPSDIAAADFNGDGILDLGITIDHNTTFYANLFILPGLGNGVFDEDDRWLYGWSNWGEALATADFDEDGTIDVAVAESQQTSVLLNRASCANATTVQPGTGPQAGGQSVTISGTNLSGAVSVTFGGMPATITGNTATSITVLTPAHAAGVVTIVVQTAGGTDSITNGYTYQAAAPGIPAGVAATAVTATRIDVAWTAVAGATSYQIDRKSPGGSFVQIGTSNTNAYVDNSVSTATSYLYRVRAVNDVGTSDNSAADLATTLFFTDSTLTTSTRVKAVHLAELRNAVDAVRTLAGLGAGSYTDSAASGVRIKAIHITQLRTALDTARSALGLTTGGYTDGSLSGVAVKGAHMQGLRDRVQ